MNDSYRENFTQAFNALNKEQQQAVKSYEGPLMVVAGPGTGKTQLLAVRIGYILSQGDVRPNEILALTFTDAGAIAMRKRLLQFIGPVAYNVEIFTFHAFCSKVIRENRDIFGGHRGLEPVTELEQNQIMRNIIDAFDDKHVLKRWSGNVYYEQGNLLHLISTMKQEHWSIEAFETAAEEHFEAFLASDEARYKVNRGKNKKGDLKQNKVKELRGKLDKAIAASKVSQIYQEKMIEANRFDFQDMILWVIKAFEEHESLLLDYQERYQYIMVDEYQDTNGSQNDLLFLLASYWDAPNLFVVGDDDQSIYRFQGANMQNLVDFQEKFKAPVIIMTSNYRSSQTILDYSKKLISINEERLVKHLSLEKNLQAKRTDIPNEAKPQILVFPNVVQESVFLANYILDQYHAGVDLSNIAVLYRSHKEVEDVVKYLSYKRIPLQLKREVNVLETPDVSRLLIMLQYIREEIDTPNTAEELLFKILHYEYFDLTPMDIGKLSTYQYKVRKANRKKPISEHVQITWREMIQDESRLKDAGIQNVAGFMHASNTIESLIKSSFNVTLQVLFEQLLTTANVIGIIMQSDESTWRMQVINCFFDFIKELSTKNPAISISELLENIELMTSNNIRLPLVRIVSDKGGVQFLTLHSSKGLEFDTVFMFRNDSACWKPRYNRGFIIPEGLVASSAGHNEEDDRRLVYVGMTRARNTLLMSYATHNANGKAIEPARHIIEIEDDISKHQVPSISEEKITEYQATILKWDSGTAQYIDANLIDRVLEKFVLSATGLNKYLRCPLSFYFENILRVPGSRNKYNGFGNAMHGALEEYFKTFKNQPQELPGVDLLIQKYEQALLTFRAHFTEKEFQDAKIYGTQCLTSYFEEYSRGWLLPERYELEVTINNVQHAGIPISGQLDRVAIYPHGVEVVDYKTGKYSKARPKLKPPLDSDDLGGDYWRQIVFYAILWKQYKMHDKPFKKGTMSFLEREKEDWKIGAFEIAPFEIDIVTQQMQQAYQGIHNHEFQGCQEDTCKWCDFVKKNFIIEQGLSPEESES